LAERQGDQSQITKTNWSWLRPTAYLALEETCWTKTLWPTRSTRHSISNLASTALRNPTEAPSSSSPMLKLPINFCLPRRESLAALRYYG